jgi:uncharacterized membrane protein
VQQPVDPVPAERGIERLVFFSDAVFAIALTLLAIDLRLPDTARITTSAQLVDAVLAVGPQLYSFCLSFFVIILLWVGHYRTFRVVTEVDGATILLNTLLLFCVVLLPFPTSILGTHPDIPAAVALYGIAAGVTTLASTLVWFLVAEVRHHVGGMPPHLVRLITLRAAVVPAVVVVTIPIAFVDTRIPLAVWILLWPIQLVMERRFRLRLNPQPQKPVSPAAAAPSPAGVPGSGPRSGPAGSA